MSTTEVDLSSVDLADPALWDAGPPYELFARMQREAPVHFSAQAVAPDEGGFWSVTTAEHMRTVTRDFKTYSSERRGIFNVDDIGIPLDIQRLQMISMDPAAARPAQGAGDQGVHARPGRRAPGSHQPDHQPACSTAWRIGSGFDLVADVARPIPARVIGSVLGTPPEDDPTLVHWTNVFTAFEDPEIREQWSDTQADLHRDHRVRRASRWRSAARSRATIWSPL